MSDTPTSDKNVSARLRGINLPAHKFTLAGCIAQILRDAPGFRLHVKEIAREIERRLGVESYKTTDVDPTVKSGNTRRQSNGKGPLFRTYSDGEEMGYVTLLCPEEFTANDESYIRSYVAKRSRITERKNKVGGPAEAPRSAIKMGEAFDELTRNSLQIEVLLPAGGERGLKHAHIQNRTIHAFACTPPLLNVLVHGFKKDCFHTKRPGIYVIFGTASNGGLAFYIGQSLDIISRLTNHRDQVPNERERFKEIYEFLFFVASDNHINIDYLEATLIRLANRSHGSLINQNWPSPPLYRDGAKRSADEQLRVVSLLASVLGYNVFLRKAGPLDRHFVLRAQNDLVAYGSLRNEGFIVFGGSLVKSTITSSTPPYIRRLRQRLFDDGVLVRDGEHYRFTEDYFFSSVHHAASIIAGTHRNGKQAWIDQETGRMLGDLFSSLPDDDPSKNSTVARDLPGLVPNVDRPSL